MRIEEINASDSILYWTSNRYLSMFVNGCVILVYAINSNQLMNGKWM